MERKTKSHLIYLCLVLVLCISTFLFGAFDRLSNGLEHSLTYSSLSFLIRNPSHFTLIMANMIFKLVSIGAIGIFGIYFSAKISFKDILNDEIKQKKNISLIIFTGIIMSLYFIGYETLFYEIFRVPILPYDYSSIPSAIFASIVEGIGDQILQMLCISFLVWLFSKLIKSESGRNKLFWVVAAVCALGFSIGHISSTMVYQTSFKYGEFFGLNFYEFMIIIGLYSPLALVCAYFIKRFGLLSAIAIHFITDISWRVLWAWIQNSPLLFR